MDEKRHDDHDIFDCCTGDPGRGHEPECPRSTVRPRGARRAAVTRKDANAMRCDPRDLRRVTDAGWKVERWGRHGWLLLDPEGAPRMIGDQGHCAPTMAEAVAEGLERIALG